MELAREWSEFQVLGLVGAPEHQPRNDPRLRVRKGKNQRALNGVYDNSSLYKMSHTEYERSMLPLECRAALNPGPRPLFERLPLEPHALNVCEGVWMSDLYTATDESTLQTLKITHVVAIYGPRETRPLYPQGYRTQHGEELRFFCMFWEEAREPCVDVAKLEEVHRWIAEALWTGGDGRSSEISTGNNVLIHSLTGCRRAAAVALAMLAPSMERRVRHSVFEKLHEKRPAAVITPAMFDALIPYWNTYAKEDTMIVDASIPIFGVEDVFNTTFPAQEDREIVRPQYEWENNTRPLATSGVITRDVSLTYSAVLEGMEVEQTLMEEAAPHSPAGDAAEDDEDQATEVADGDVGNALLGDLQEEPTLEAIDIYAYLPQKSFQPEGYRDSPDPWFDQVEFERAHGVYTPH